MCRHHNAKIAPKGAPHGRDTMTWGDQMVRSRRLDCPLLPLHNFLSYFFKHLGCQSRTETGFCAKRVQKPCNERRRIAGACAPRHPSCRPLPLTLRILTEARQNRTWGPGRRCRAASKTLEEVQVGVETAVDFALHHFLFGLERGRAVLSKASQCSVALRKNGQITVSRDTAFLFRGSALSLNRLYATDGVSSFSE